MGQVNNMNPTHLLYRLDKSLYWVVSNAGENLIDDCVQAGILITFGVYVFHLRIQRKAVEKREKRKRLGLCAFCGYDLTGNVNGICSECGKKGG